MKQAGSEGTSHAARDRLAELEAHHRSLDDRLKELGNRSYLTPSEQTEVVDLKKRKLLAKDSIAALRRDL